MNSLSLSYVGRMFLVKFIPSSEYKWICSACDEIALIFLINVGTLNLQSKWYLDDCSSPPMGPPGIIPDLFVRFKKKAA